MTRTLRRSLAFQMLSAIAGIAHAAGNALPPFRVDPVLLGLPPLPAEVVAGSAAQPPPTVASDATVSTRPIPVPDVEKRSFSPAPVIAPMSSARPASGTSVLPPEGQPTYVVADRIDGTTGVETVAQGNVDMRRGDRNIKADRLVYREKLDETEATGNVKLAGPGEAISGPHLKLKMGDSVGTFETPAYSIHRQNSEDPAATAHGTAARLDFQGKDKYHLKNATYTTCPANGSSPDWFARVTDLSLDYAAGEGEGRGATVVFKDVPILYMPWMSFTLDNRRKTGMLAPTIGSTSKGGGEITTPFYWNIAPDMDATLAPRLMSKRGTQLSGEYRYLGQSYAGKMAGEYLENDRIARKNRSALTILHRQNFGDGLNGSLNLNGVSDDAYFTDLSTRLSDITQTNLLREGRINYGAGWWSANLMAQRYQTLQDPTQPPIAIPYDRLPQLLVSANRPDLPWGTEMKLSAEYVSFSNPTGTKVEGNRTTLYPQLAYPIQTAAFYLTPKLGFHSTQYRLSQQAAGVPDNISRNVPIFSLDSGMVFERPLQLFNQEFTQTLEPRAYYLRVPQRDQSLIPLFDSGVADFNFAQIFSENAFTGGDRISDANQLTVAATSRILDTNSGEELLRGAFGQRYYFTDQTVVIPGVAPRTRRIADLLGALTGKVSREVSIDSGVQYNNQDSQVERLNLGARYQPEPSKVFNAGYRYTRTLLRQIDTSAQWPIFGGWHAVGRYNYSLRDKRVIEAIAGLEYDGGCWATRFVAQRVAAAAGQVNNSIFVQLELNGFSQIGSNPLNLLRRNIPGYSRINESEADPAFAE